MSYRNPQQITNNMFNVNDLVEKANADLSKELSKPQENTVERYNKQQKLASKSNKFSNDIYEKVGGLKGTGFEKFDINQQDYFYDRISQYVKIKNAMGNGTMPDESLGNRALNDIESELELYGRVQPQILAVAEQLQAAYKIPMGETGSLSLAGIPSDQQEVIVALTQGEDVRLVNRNNQLFLYYPEGRDGKGAFINGNEFANLEASGKQYIKTVPDISEVQKNAVTNTFFPAGKDNPVSKYVTFNTKQVPQGNGRVMEVKTKTTTAEQAEQAMEDMVSNGQFSALLKNDDFMSSIWTDKMGNDATGINSWHAGNQQQMDNQDAEALAYLAKSSVQEYLTGLGVELVTGTSTRNVDDDDDDKVEVVNYDTIIPLAKAFEKALKNPNRVISTGKNVNPEDVESGKVQQLSKTEVDLRDKLTDNLKERFGGSGFSTGSGTKVIQDIKIKYKDGELLFFPLVDYSTTKNKDYIKTLKEYSLGIPLTSERLLKFEKQLKQIAKDSVVSSETKPKAY
jgi:hypothetical protein